MMDAHTNDLKRVAGNAHSELDLLEKRKNHSSKRGLIPPMQEGYVSSVSANVARIACIDC